MSEQERNDQQTEPTEAMQDLDVSEEQQDDVTGGRASRMRGDDLRKK